MLWGLWILLHPHNVFIFRFIRQLPSDCSWMAAQSQFWFLLLLLLFVLFSSLLKSFPRMCGSGVGSVETGMESLHRIRDSPSLVSPFYPHTPFQLMWLIWILSSDSSGQRDRCLLITAVPTVACSQDQSHKKLVTSPMQFPSSQCWLPSKAYVLSSLTGAWRLCVRTRMCFIYGRVSSAESRLVTLHEKPPKPRHREVTAQPLATQLANWRCGIPTPP